MKKQEIFDTVVMHLRSMPQQSTQKDEIGMDMCAYRGSIVNGIQLKCAIGVLIPDEKYVQEMEGHDAWGLLHRWDFGLYAHKLLLSNLQPVHDSENCWDDNGFSNFGERKLRDVAQDHGLNYRPRTA